jgi:hypothetical protein
MMKRLFVLCALALAAGLVRGQGGINDPYYALNLFLSTDFFKQYDAMRIRAENSVKDFKRIQYRYSDEEVKAVSDAYNASAEYFNQVLYNIKGDILNKEKNKYIIQFPADYSKQIEADLYRAKDFYSNTYQKELSRVTNGELNGFAILALLPQIMQYAPMAIELFKKIQEQMKKFNENMLDQYLIQPYHFKTWDEIQ